MDQTSFSGASSLPPTVPAEQSSIVLSSNTANSLQTQLQVGSPNLPHPPPIQAIDDPEDRTLPQDTPSEVEPERSINWIISWLSSFRATLNSPNLDRRCLEIRAAGLNTVLKKVQEERNELRDELRSMKVYYEQNQTKTDTELMAVRNQNQKLKENIAWYDQKLLTGSKTYRPRHLQDSYLTGAQQLQSDIESWSAGIQFTDIDVVDPELLQHELNKLGPIAESTTEMFIASHPEFQVPFIRHVIALVLYTVLLNRYCPDMSAETSSAMQMTEDKIVIENDWTLVYQFREAVSSTHLKPDDLSKLKAKTMNTIEAVLASLSVRPLRDGQKKKLRKIVDDALSLSCSIARETVVLYRWMWMHRGWTRDSVKDKAECLGGGDRVLWCMFPALLRLGRSAAGQIEYYIVAKGRVELTGSCED